ncbi:MAG: ABC-type Na+ efflux pump permease subunit [Natronomonas sp.]|jgi:ABC-type Na+ efflux pump permease subunit|uniref:PrsW family intramembrane metalloprotease n=1 Tax=Natronomonas sp. TaxID=2184060 RepID=UPI0039891C6D
MRPRKLLRIARWEVTKGIGGLDRGVIAVAIAATAFVLAVGVMGLVGGAAIEDGIYRVGVDEGSDFHDPIADDPTFAVVEPSPDAVQDGHLVAADRYDLYITERAGRTVIYLATENGERTEKSRAALAALRESIDRYNDRQMARESNETAAFPVTVTIQYVDRQAESTPTAGTGGGSGGSGGGGSEDTDGSETTETPTGDSGGRFGAPSLGAFDLFGTASTSGSPSDIQPPFPFQSLVLAFLFVLPLNFLIQAYGSSMLSERLDRRGELLLVAPVSRSEIVFGKTLPYLLGSIAITSVTVAGLWLLGSDAGPLSVLAVVPLALLFLATTFLGAMFARSFKELTFVTVTVSTVLTCYAFVPAIFAETSAVAFVSPLTIAVKDLTSAGVTPGQFVFSTGPPTLVACICFLLGLGVYREEDLFTQRPVHLKALDALAGRIRRPRSLVLVVALLVPFVFVAELLAVALLFALPVALSVPLVFAIIAVIEELAKGLPVYAGYVHSQYDRTVVTAVTVGAAAGTGFFLAEKLSLLVQLVGLPGQPVADAAFQTGLGAGDPFVIALLAIAPFGLHVVTATLSSLGASRGRTAFAAGLCSAILVHVAYNVTVVSRLV